MLAAVHTPAGGFHPIDDDLDRVAHAQPPPRALVLEPGAELVQGPPARHAPARQQPFEALLAEAHDLLRPRLGSLATAARRVDRVRRAILAGPSEVPAIVARVTQFAPEARLPSSCVSHRPVAEWRS